MRTLQQKGKFENVIQEMDRIKLNILGLDVVKWKGAGSMKLGSKTLIYSEGHTHRKGVAILFDVTTAKSLGSWCPISDRVVVAKLVAKPFKSRNYSNQVGLYAPTSYSEDVEEKKFYEEIKKAKGYLKSQNIIIVMGDFNAKVGYERVEDVGPSGIGTVNARGSRLIEWCQVNDFTITNTWYQNHPRRQWTWKSPRYRLPGADCDSDHIPIKCKFQMILKKLRQRLILNFK
ncbi:craniofacial development protein 2-like protein [Plakobranchus ocellatus]|uniref:Craniofacial development protein 2-like protein n=1 Tax=Plakobranchus ocellatus TaxID=259542 RepID=A0AAV4AAS1_9GAST|nr:craniofacial development protein 2-like protein [Plakobranchus ocellatus]